ncbi:PAN domain protein [Cooperia oncophora]
MWTTVTLSSLIFSLPLVYSTTEWWGDLRAHLNPARSPAFYDVTYDETECPQGLRSDAIPDYVYFGTMMATMSVDVHEQCLQKCLEKTRCKAVNYFHPFAYQKKGFCELLSETQRDNPRLMRPFRMATYFENIKCKEVDDVADDLADIVNKPAHPRDKKLEMKGLVKKLSNKVHEFNSGFRAAR